MQLEDYFDFISPLEIRIKGHRLGIEDVVKLYHEGYSPEQIALEFPGLSFEKIHATITYYLHYKGDVDAYLARRLAWEEQEYQAWLAESDPPPVVQRLRALKAQREQEQQLGHTLST